MKKKTKCAEIDEAARVAQGERIEALLRENERLRRERDELRGESEFQNSIILRQRELLTSLESVRQWAFTLSQQVKLLIPVYVSRLLSTATFRVRDIERVEYAAKELERKASGHAAVLAGIKEVRAAANVRSVGPVC